MKHYLLSTLALILLISSCSKTPNPFEVSKHHVGLLTDSTQVKDLEMAFPNDSVVKFITGDEFVGNSNAINIYEKGGKKLLALTPKFILDSTSVISNVRIFDERYKTEKNISSISTFKDINDNYKISRISNLINSIVVAVDDINASFTIDKKELPANLRFDMDLKFEPTHIPDHAKVKYFFINWNI
ncbi:hypothetical protein KFZ70_08735 [Tamlana fucoidanivorans]|uniref:DUF4292 domain-containing protein n=1 Tax=Allotamlana fucoidanivorans TaxID=2583814 RepID=A0A5C4SQ68_9FLAO|nr:hypothetical protein [Tamlana fucoidanivorans]TNJ46153.1 hypothetical protein FGF67_03945 [Tamlana fucoidanivorans]